jgi:hypothetical protein
MSVLSCADILTHSRSVMQPRTVILMRLCRLRKCLFAVLIHPLISRHSTEIVAVYDDRASTSTLVPLARPSITSQTTSPQASVSPPPTAQATAPKASTEGPKNGTLRRPSPLQAEQKLTPTPAAQPKQVASEIEAPQQSVHIQTAITHRHRLQFIQGHTQAHEEEEA